MTPAKVAFLLGMVVGSIVGFMVAAILVVGGLEDSDE